jgi:hypothetical protein
MIPVSPSASLQQDKPVLFSHRLQNHIQTARFDETLERLRQRLGTAFKIEQIAEEHTSGLHGRQFRLPPWQGQTPKPRSPDSTGITLSQLSD